ncbi:MAG: protein kinase [Planctomycetaceae bacterium]
MAGMIIDDGGFPEGEEFGKAPTLISQVEPPVFVTEPPVLPNPRYEVGELLQTGGTGAVYRARDRRLARDVAVKVQRLDPKRHPEAVAGYVNEARIMSYLSHPGVIPIYDSGDSEDGRPFYIMKLVEGATLLDLVNRQSAGAARLLEIFSDVCQTMAYAHSRGVVHADLKPANIMVGEYGQVYVMDWGLARFPAQPVQTENACPIWFSWAAHQTGGVSGTPGYMSPEQARGEILDARTDVFGLGGILSEILLGQPPYQGTTVKEIYRRALAGWIDPTLERLENTETDRVLVALAKKCLAPDREQRPPDGKAVAREIARYQEFTLQQAESDMNRFFELSLDLFCIADFEGYFRRINGNFHRILGHSEADLMSRPFLEFVHSEDQQETIDCMSVLREGQPVVRFQNRYRTATGDYLRLEWTAKAIESEGLIFAVARDVSDVRKAKACLHSYS